MLRRPHWVLQAAYSTLGKLLWPIYQVTSKAVSFKSGLGRALHQLQHHVT